MYYSELQNNDLDGFIPGSIHKNKYAKIMYVY